MGSELRGIFVLGDFSCVHGIRTKPFIEMKKLLAVLAFVGLGFSATAQTGIPNSSFEAFSLKAGVQGPDGWHTSNTAAQTTVTQSSDAQDQSTAVRIETKMDASNLPLGSISIGVAPIDAIDGDDVTPGFSLGTTDYKALRYHYKYQPSGTDTAFALLILTRWNATEGKREITDYMLHNKLSSTSEYVSGYYEFLDSTGFKPDSGTIIFSSSYEDARFSTNKAQTGSVLIVDNVRLLTANEVTSVADFKAGKIWGEVFPNPATDEVTILSAEKGTFQLYDGQGRLVKEIKVEDEQVVRLGGESGIYFYHFTDMEGVVRRRGKLIVQ